MYDRGPHRRDLDYVVGVDLGQSQDYTAIAIVERVRTAGFDPETLREQEPVISYRLAYLDRRPLGTRYPAIVAGVLALLDRAPLSRETPLVVDRTGVGRPVTDMFAEAGVEPEAITIHGGDAVTSEHRHHRVPKRDLVTTLLKLYQTGRFEPVEGLALFPAFVNELVNFKVKINIATGNDSYEAWRESVHDDLVLAVALACWYWEYEASKQMEVDPEALRVLQGLQDGSWMGW